MPCKLDEILRFKWNSSPERMYLAGCYQYPELLWVLYNIHTRTKNFWVLWVLYDIHTRTRNFRKICTPVPQYPGYGCSIFLPGHNVCKLCTPVPEYPELLEVLEDFYARTRNFCWFCMTFIPVPGTSVSSVCPVPQYPGYGYGIFGTRPELLCVLYARVTIAGTSASSGILSYPCPRLRQVLQDSHTLTRNPQTLQNI